MAKCKRVSTGAIMFSILGACAMALLSMQAVAQPGDRGRPQIDPEKMKKAIELESAVVAQDLGLPAEQAKKLTEAYSAARKSYMEAMRASRSGGRPDPGAMRAVSAAERGKLEAALKGFLTPEQTTKALATLGSFNRRWDQMVLCLDGMNLDEKAKKAAMKLVTDYVATSAKALEAAAAANDFASMRETSMKMKQTLDTEMAKLLSADQMKRWSEETEMRGGRGGRMGGGAPGQSAPPAAPAAAPKAPAK